MRKKIITHEVKLLPEYYDAEATGKKPFTIRYNDRDYAVGDTLHSREWNMSGYTGREFFAKITYVLVNLLACSLVFASWG